MPITLREFLTTESARCFKFVTFTRRGKKQPFAVFTSAPVAARHPRHVDTGVVVVEHRRGHYDEEWLDLDIYDGITVREVV